MNGLVTARGRVNGLVGAQGRINGIVNGTPFVRPHMKGLRLLYPSRRVRYASIASAIVVAVIIVGLLVIPIPGPTSPISIDGSFGDWAGIGDLTPPANATVQAPAPAPELSGRTINAPEFQEMAVPIAFTLVVVLLAVRRRRQSD